MIDPTESHKLEIEGSTVTIIQGDSSESVDSSEITELSIVEDYRLLDGLDLLVQSFFGLCFVLLLGSFTLLLFVGVDVSSPYTVARSLFETNLALTSVLFGMGLVTPSALFLVYYRMIRPRVIETFSPSESIVEFSVDGTQYKLCGIDQQTAHELTVETQEVTDT